MDWLNIVYVILGILATLVSTVLPLVYKLVKSVKAYKAAKTEAEAEKAYNDMLTQAQSLIQAAESAFEGFDKVMKAQNSSAGAMKKDNVVSKLQAYALSNGYAYDAEFWSEKIDEIVKFTRRVNSTTAAKTAVANNATPVATATVIKKY